MTSPSGGFDRTYRTLYQAVADYSDLIRKSKDAQAARRAMHDEDVKGSKESAKADKEADEVAKLRAASTRTLSAESRNSASEAKKFSDDAHGQAQRAIDDESKLSEAQRTPSRYRDRKNNYSFQGILKKAAPVVSESEFGASKDDDTEVSSNLSTAFYEAAKAKDQLRKSTQAESEATKEATKVHKEASAVERLRTTSMKRGETKVSEAYPTDLMDSLKKSLASAKAKTELRKASAEAESKAIEATRAASIQAAEEETNKIPIESVRTKTGIVSLTGQEVKTAVQRINVVRPIAREAEDSVRRESTTLPVQDVPNVAKKSVDDETESVKKLGEETDKSKSELGSIFDFISSGMKRAKKDTEDTGASVKKYAESLRDASNDYIPAHGKPTPGRHRIVDELPDLVPRAGTGGGGSGGGRGGGGDPSGASGAADSGKKAVKAFDELLSKSGPVIGGFVTMASSIAPIITALASLGGLLVGAASGFVQLSGAAAALPGLFLAGATSIGALLVAFQPLTNIFKAYQAQQKASLQDTKDVAKETKAAAQAVIDARVGEKQAENSYADAQLDSRRATQKLTDARRDAIRTLEDLHDQVNRDKLDEVGSNLSYQRAVQDYKKTLADPNATLLDREEALLKVKQAQMDLADQQKKGTRDQEDLARADKKGVEGSDAVIDAKRAQRDALINVTKTQNDLHKSIDTLNEALHVQAHGGTASAAAYDTLQKALKSASPSTKTFAEGLLSLDKPFKNIQKNVSEDMFKPLVGQLGNIKGFLPTLNTLLTDSATAIGKVIAKGIALVTSGPWKADFATLSKSNAKIIGKLGDAALYVITAFKDIAVAAAPFTEWIAGAIGRVAKGFADWAKTERGNGGIAAFLDRTEKFISLLWKTIKNFGTGLWSLFKASQGFADWMWNGLEKLSEKFKQWSKAQEDPTSRFSKWLENIKPVLSGLGDLIGAIAVAIGHIGSDPKNLNTTTGLLKLLKDDILPPIQRIVNTMGQSGLLEKIGAALSEVLNDIADFIAGGGPLGLETFVGIIKGFIDVISGLLKIPGVIPILEGVFIGLSAFGALRLITKLPIISELIGGLGWLINNKGGYMDALKSLPGFFKNAFLSSIGLGDLVKNKKTPGSAGTTGSGIAGKNWALLFEKFNIKIALEETMNKLLESILVSVNRILGAMGASGLENDLDNGINTPNKNKAKPTVAEEEKLAKEAEAVAAKGGKFGRFGKVLAPVLETGASVLGLDFLTKLFGGGSKPAATTPEAARQGTTPAAEATDKPGLFSRIWNAITGKAGAKGGEEAGAKAAGRVALSGGRLAELGDPLAWAGLGVGVAADTIWTGKDRQKPAAQLTRAGGAVLSGAGIGAMFGPEGAAAGAIAGGAYSLYKDPGLRKTVGNALTSGPGQIASSVIPGGSVLASLVGKALQGNNIEKMWDGAYEGFMNKVGSPLAHWFKDTLPDAVKGFFTKTLPGYFGKLKDYLLSIPGDILEAVGAVAADVEDFVTKDIPHFFTKTIPHWFDNVKDFFVDAWHGVENFFTKDVPNFFTKTIPHWWSSITGAVKNAWHGVTNFFTKDVPNFFTKTIPSWWHSITGAVKSAWHGVTNFFTKDIPAFFTKTIPTWFHGLLSGVKSGWNNVVSFFTKDIPNFITKTIPSWFHGLGDSLIDAIIKPFKDFFGVVWDFIKDHIGKGYNKEKQANAASTPAGYQEGGEIRGTYIGREDTEHIMATPGETVVKRSISQQPIVKSFLKGLNEGKMTLKTVDVAEQGKRAVTFELPGLQQAVREVSFAGSASPRATMATNGVANATTNVYNHDERNFGDVHVYNPKPERASTSIRRTVESLAYDTDRDERGRR